MLNFQLILTIRSDNLELLHVAAGNGASSPQVVCSAQLEQTGAVGAQRAVPKRSPESQVQLKVAQRASRRRLHTAGQHAVFAAALFFFRLGSELK